MHRLTLYLCLALLALLGSSFQTHASENNIFSDHQDQYLSTSNPAVQLDFNQDISQYRFRFEGNSGDQIQLELGDNTFLDHCALTISIFDSSGRQLSLETCAAKNGHPLNFSVPQSGLYLLKLDGEPSAVGSIKLKLNSLVSNNAKISPQDTCQLTSLALDTVVSGSWDSTCTSTYFGGGQHYAQYYTITVPSTEVITISLTSSGTATDAFLALRNGSGLTGTVVTADNNNGPGNNSQIVINLPAGTYTIEATTYNTLASGGFKLVARTNTSPCFSSIKLNQVKNGNWTTDCTSVYFQGGEHYAKYYTLSISNSQVVTLTLSSSGTATDAFLVLKNGNTQLGTVVAADDNNGPGSNAELVLTLPAGTYTIEATTYNGAALGGFSLAVRTDQRPCFRNLSLNKVISSEWTDKCNSVYFSGGEHYAKYYTLTIPTDEVVTITLTSTSTATDAFLAIRNGNTQLGSVIVADDNNGPGSNSEIAINLPAGTYTIEATTYNALALGGYTLVARTNTTPCFASLSLDTPLSDSWTTDCTSLYFQGGEHFAKYYTLTIPTEQIITTTLTSSSTATDAFLAIRSGTTQLAAVYAANDNNGPGNNAELVLDLLPGTYTIEATTYNTGVIGDFSIVSRTNTAPCFASIAPNSVVNDTWITDCTSLYFQGGEHYAKYYNLTLPAQANVTLTLTSASLATDAFLVLRNGSTQVGSVIKADDNGGGGTNSKITTTLPAGNYTIEATTYGGLQLGDFTFTSTSN